MLIQTKQGCVEAQYGTAARPLAPGQGTGSPRGGWVARSAQLLAKLGVWLSMAYGVWRARAADQRGSQITDNLGLVVIGIVAIIAIGGLISGLDKTVFNWVTSQLGLSSGGGAG